MTEKNKKLRKWQLHTFATTYPTNRMATEIKQYFEANNEALEVLVAVGKKMVSVERYMISERNFYKEFRKRIEQ